jgi:predicted MFS family arabinose efflux permease
MPYSQIGITATIVITCCRIIQGIASMCEIVGAEIYISEMCKDRRRFFMVGIVIVCSNLGSNVALFLSSSILSNNINWRVIFFMGAAVALVGIIARTAIRETPDFIDAKRLLYSSLKTVKAKKNQLIQSISTQKISNKVIFSYFFMESMSPIWFYIGYFYSANIMRDKFNISSSDIIHNNFILSLAVTINFIIICYLLKKVHPLRIMKIKMIFCFPVLFFLPYIYNQVSTPQELLVVNIIIKFLSFDGFATVPIILSLLPVLKRYTYGGFIYSCSKAMMYVIMSFGIDFFTKIFGSYGILYILLPFSIAYFFSRNYLEGLERANNNYY